MITVAAAPHTLIPKSRLQQQRRQQQHGNGRPTVHIVKSSRINFPAASIQILPVYITYLFTFQSFRMIFLLPSYHTLMTYAFTTIGGSSCFSLLNTFSSMDQSERYTCDIMMEMITIQCYYLNATRICTIVSLCGLIFFKFSKVFISILRDPLIPHFRTWIHKFVYEDNSIVNIKKTQTQQHLRVIWVSNATLYL